MAAPGQMVHGAIVLVAVVVYSAFIWRGLNIYVSEHVKTVMHEELDKNPNMRRDLEDFKAKMERDNQRKEEIAELETQQRKISEQLALLSGQSSAYSARYVEMEGLTTIAHHEEMSPTEMQDSSCRASTGTQGSSCQDLVAAQQQEPGDTHNSLQLLTHGA